VTARQRALVRAPTSRPAETAGVGGSVVAAVAYLLGAPVDLVAAIAVIGGTLPAAVTFVVQRGGLVGLIRTILHGPPKD
jgi:hypothetical protein